MNFPSICYFCAQLLHWFLGSRHDIGKGRGSRRMGLATSGSIVLHLMELVSRGWRLGCSPVKLCFDGYTLQH